MSRRLAFASRDLAPRVEEAFAPTGPIWKLGRYFSPDVLIAARDEAAFRGGELELVLGEVHCGNTMAWSCFASQHPAPEELSSYVEHDMSFGFDDDGQPWILPQTPKQSWPQRMTIGLVSPRLWCYQLFDDPPDPRAGAVLRSENVVIENTAQGLMARTRDGQHCFRALELFGGELTETCNKILGSSLPESMHSPRVSVDDVVIARERWCFAADELSFVANKEPSERFLAARRWAREHGMPRWCFYKTPAEQKPCFVDFDSPIYIDILAKMISGSNASSDTKITVSEMLPTIDQTWLVDAEGNRFTAELRMVTYERTGFDCGKGEA
ncbi:MAG: hypothetical protein HC897_11985 [Thermoanaerobaculia bacterium]|nr:hypothetical protein [Thermoanaerobaculia bacterium]